MHDPTDPVGRVLFNVLAMVAEFEADLARAHTPRRHQGRKAKLFSIARSSLWPDGIAVGLRTRRAASGTMNSAMLPRISPASELPRNLVLPSTRPRLASRRTSA